MKGRKLKNELQEYLDEIEESQAHLYSKRFSYRKLPKYHPPLWGELSAAQRFVNGGIFLAGAGLIAWLQRSSQTKYCWISFGIFILLGWLQIREGIKKVRNGRK